MEFGSERNPRVAVFILETEISTGSSRTIRNEIKLWINCVFHVEQSEFFVQCKLFFRIRSERNPRIAVFILETEISTSSSRT